MPGAYLFGWDAANSTWVKCLVNAEGKLIIDPTEIFENSPTDNEHGKAPDSDWAHDHDADVGAHHNKDHASRHGDGGADPILNLGGNIRFPDRSYWFVFLSQDQNISAGVRTKLLLDSVIVDNRNEFDAENNEVVIEISGFYLLFVNVTFKTASDQDQIEATVYRNGTEILLRFLNHSSGARWLSCAGGMGYYLTADDKITLYVKNIDSNDVIVSMDYNTSFSGCLTA